MKIYSFIIIFTDFFIVLFCHIYLYTSVYVYMYVNVRVYSLFEHMYVLDIAVTCIPSLAPSSQYYFDERRCRCAQRRGNILDLYLLR